MWEFSDELAHRQPGLWRNQSFVCSYVSRGQGSQPRNFGVGLFVFLLLRSAFLGILEIPSPVTFWNVIPQCYCWPPASSIAVNRFPFLEGACVVLYSNVLKAAKSCKLRLNIVVPKLHNSDPSDLLWNCVFAVPGRNKLGETEPLCGKGAFYAFTIAQHCSHSRCSTHPRNLRIRAVREHLFARDHHRSQRRCSLGGNGYTRESRDWIFSHGEIR